MSIATYQKKKADLQKKRDAAFAEEQANEEQANAPKIDERVLTIKAKDEDIIIRFLPQGTSDRIPRVKYKMHFLVRFVNGVKKFLSWKCRKTLNEEEPCPSDDKGKETWVDGGTQEENKTPAMYYRKDQMASNVYIVDNPNDPLMNGAVKMYKFGKTIDRKIQRKLSKGIDIFCPIDGENFTLSCVEKFGNNTYEDSDFSDKAVPITKNNKEFDRILSECYNLDEIFLAESTFLSAEEIQKRFDKFETGRANLSSAKDNETPPEEVDGADDYDYDDTDTNDALDDLDFTNE